LLEDSASNHRSALPTRHGRLGSRAQLDSRCPSRHHRNSVRGNGRACAVLDQGPAWRRCAWRAFAISLSRTATVVMWTGPSAIEGGRAVSTSWRWLLAASVR